MQKEHLMVCPCCGKEIIFEKTEYKGVLMAAPGLNTKRQHPKFDFRICYECNGKFTKIPIEMRISTISGVLISCFLLFTPMIYIAQAYLDSWLPLLVGIDICLFIAMIVFIILDLKQGSNLKKCRKAYLPIINGDDMEKDVNYLDEKSLTEADIKSRTVFQYMRKAIILIPHYSNIMKICLSDRYNIKALQKYYTYKINTNSGKVYLTLCDYSVENNDIILYVKAMDNDARKLLTDEKYTLYTMEEKQVCTIKLVQ